ncbi:hypothetical protein VCHA53O466_50396 [Vibrio chagasii]|nr:hypothetical protein VCHA53O466_50396 [Vibrio chagasii]
MGVHKSEAAKLVIKDSPFTRAGDKNASYNIELLEKELHSYIVLTSNEQVNELLEFLEWLLPYKCENKSSIKQEAARMIERYSSVCIINNYFSANSKMNVASRIDLMVSLLGCPEHAAPINWGDFKHPLKTVNDTLSFNHPLSEAYR